MNLAAASFKFHCDSINIERCDGMEKLVLIFKFHCDSINIQTLQFALLKNLPNLNSTVILLICIDLHTIPYLHWYLNSTVILLISDKQCSKLVREANLNSTVILLISDSAFLYEVCKS